MANYRDYGTLNGIRVQNTEIDNITKSQVYLATHEGERRLPFMNRSFISFSFGGKNIEDFDLISVTNGEYLQKSGYSDFEDITSDYDILDGHFYWGTRYTNHILKFSLATDSITQIQLERFLQWFSAGKIRELILSEHPNRAIMARVESTPELNLAPFEKKVITKIAGTNYSTSTTVYRGGINLSLITEEPFWYSKVNIFGFLNNGIYQDTWYDANGILRSVYDDPDAIKVSLEDNIPISSMIQVPMLLGDNKFALSNLSTGGGCIAPEDKEYTSTELKALSIIYKIAKEDGTEGACITGTIISEANGIENFESNVNQYFYYCGTAPCLPELIFNLTPELLNDYIVTPINSKTSGTKKYNTITIESLTPKTFKFTTPSVYTAYNKTIEIFKSAEEGQAWNEIRESIRDKVSHPAVRAWANAIIDNFSSIINNVDINNAIYYMPYFLKDKTGKVLSSKFTINNKTGKAIGELKYRDIDPLNTTVSDWSKYGTISTHEEDIGDMIRSNHLIIEDRNYPTSDGQIIEWRDTNEETRSHSYRIIHDVNNGLQNVFIIYKNMYL